MRVSRCSTWHRCAEPVEFETSEPKCIIICAKTAEILIIMFQRFHDLGGFGWLYQYLPTRWFRALDGFGCYTHSYFNGFGCRVGRM